MIIDARARERAIDPRSSFTVTAPAGSGKTELLTQRYLSLLAVVEQPEAILAITFTRKAVAEMRARILTALTEAKAIDKPPNDLPAHRQKTMQLAQAALRADNERQWGLLDNPARLRVYTFDAFSASLVRQMPIASRFGGAASPAERPDILYRQAIEHVLDHLGSASEHSESLQHLLLHMNVRVSHVASLLTEMLAKRDQWRGLFASMQGNPEQAVEVLHQWFCEQVEFTLHKAHELLYPFQSELCSLINFANSQLHELGGDVLLNECDEVMSALPKPTVKELPKWRVVAQFLLTKQGSLRATVNIRQGFPAKKNKPQYTVDDFKALVAHIGENEDAFAILAELHILPDPQDIRRHQPLLGSLMNVLHLAMAYLELEFQKNQQVDFVATSLQALEALADNSDLAMKLDYSIQHILVDEFQDTSQLQYDLLDRICQEWSETDNSGRSLFLVGDAMQSIYSFRNARVALFMHARQFGLAGVGCENLDLQSNFRSHEPIIEWLNHCFKHVFPGKDDLRHNAPAYVATSCTRSPAEPDSEVHAYEFAIDQDPDRRIEAAYVANRVRVLQSSYPNDSIAILVRNRRHANHFLPALRAAGVDVAFTEFDRFIDKPVVADLLNLTRLLLNPADQLAWYAFLRSPLMDLPLADLLQISHYSRYDVFKSIKLAEQTDSLEQASKQRLTVFLAAYEVMIKRRQRKSLVNDVVGLWKYLGGDVIYSDRQDQTAIRRYHAELLTLNSALGAVCWEQIDEHMAQLRTSAAVNTDSGAVELMTMHKAKGLEFDSVLLPALDLGVKSEGAELLSWTEQFVSPTESALLLGVPEKNRYATRSAYDYVREQNRIQARHEAARLLYVACSRARKRLYVYRGFESSKPDQNASTSLAALLWQHLPVPATRIESPNVIESGVAGSPRPLSANSKKHCLDLGALKTLQNAERGVHDGAPSEVPNNLSKPTDWVLPSTDDARHLFERCIGVVVHRNLQQLAHDQDQYWQISDKDQRVRIKTQLLANGLRSDLNDATEWVEKALNAARQDRRHQWVFHGGRSEIEFRLFDGEEVTSIVLDREVEDSSGHAWIIDYKIHLNEAATEQDLQQLANSHLPQLQRYRRAFTTPRRLAVYFVLQQVLIEID